MRWHRSLPEILALGVGLLLWWGVAEWSGLPRFILPSPVDVYHKARYVILSGLLWKHAWATLVEVVLGLLLGLSVALPLGYLMARFWVLERAMR